MSETPRSSFRLVNFLVKESHFVLNNAGEYEFEQLIITPSGIVKKSDNIFQLELAFEAVEKSQQVSIKVISLSFFEYKDIEDVSNSPFFLQNAPAIAFPYLRAYVSTLTTQSGIPPIILPTLNVTSLTGMLKDAIAIYD